MYDIICLIFMQFSLFRMYTWWLDGCPLLMLFSRQQRLAVTQTTGCSSLENQRLAPSSTSSPEACWRMPSKSPMSPPLAWMPVCTQPSTTSVKCVEHFKSFLKMCNIWLKEKIDVIRCHQYFLLSLFPGHSGYVLERTGVQLHVLLRLLLSCLCYGAP